MSTNNLLTRCLLLLWVASVALGSLPAPLLSVHAAPPSQGDVQAQAYALIKEGMGLYSRGDLKGALERFQAALPLFREIDDQAGEAAALGNIGAIYIAMGQSQQALTLLEQALSIQRQIGNLSGEGTTLGTLGTVYYNLAQYEQALDYYQQALAIIEVMGRRADEATMLAAVGAVYDATGQPRQALDYCQQALIIQDQIGDQVGEADTLGKIGAAYLDMGQLQQALTHLEQALTIQRQVGDRPGDEAFTLSKIGTVYAAIGQSQQALDYYQQALAIQRQVGGQLGEAAILDKIGTAYLDVGQTQQALTYFEQALTIQRQIGARAGEAETLLGLGAVYHSLGQHRQALSYYQQALVIATAIGDRRREGELLSIIGVAYLSMGQPQQALDYHQQALTIQRQVSDQFGEATTLNNIGAIYYELAQPQEALANFQRALAISREIGSRSNEANTLSHIGGVYQEILGQLPRALDYYQQALRIYQEVGARQGEAHQLNNIGYIHSDLDQTEQALEHYKQALTILREVGDRRSEAVTLDNIGVAYSRLDQPQKAMTFHREALSLHLATGDQAGEVNTLNNIGALYCGLGQPQQALAYFQQALPIARDIGDRQGEAITLDNTGISYLVLGQQAEAFAHFRQSIEIIETIRGGMSIEELKSGFATRYAGYYQTIAPLLLELCRPEEAFAYAERGRARTFLDQLSNVRVDPRQDANPALIEDEQRLVGEIADLDRHMRELISQPTNPQTDEIIADLQTQLTAKRAEYADLLIQLKLSNPAYAALISVDPLTLEQIQTKVLTENTTLVSYFVTYKQTIAFVVSRDSFAAIPIAVTGQELGDRVAAFRSLITLEAKRSAGRLSEDRISTAQALYDILLSPLSSYLPTTPEGSEAPHSATPSLIIVPHDVLHYLPFAALLDSEGAPLSTRFTLSVAPSASALGYAQANQNPDDSRLLALGNPVTDLPSLPYAEREVEAISALYPLRTTFTGPTATEVIFRTEVTSADWVHLAAHAELNPTSPLFSVLYLAGEPAVESRRSPQAGQDMEENPTTSNSDGRLEVHEIFNLNLTGVNGVVLSACETGLGEQSRGDELVGLTRAFLYAGTPVVVASLWEVEDEATAALMTTFHRGLRAGLEPAAALRTAQEEVQQDSRWIAPYYWAGFQVIGDGGPSAEPAGHQETITDTVAPATPPSSDAGLTRLRTSIAGLLALLGIVGWAVWRQRNWRPS